MLNFDICILVTIISFNKITKDMFYYKCLSVVLFYSLKKLIFYFLFEF